MIFTEYYSVLLTQLEWLMTNWYLTTLASVILLFIKVSVIVPLFLLGLLYIQMLVITICGLIFRLKDPSPENKSWDILRFSSFQFWHVIGRFWHGHEIEGLENVPSKGPALMLYYHGAMAFDSYILAADVYLLRNRLMSFVMNKMFNYLPGWRTPMKMVRASSGSPEMCTNILNNGHLLTISPGGAYECLFSDHNYRLEWRNRLGYAKVAIQAKVPIIPFFTVNNREAFRGVNIGKSFFEKLYLKWRWQFKPVYGGYPVKLRTVFGEPIPYDPTLTPEQLDQKVRMAMEQLIKDNQRLPGSIAMALLDRVYCPKKVNSSLKIK